MKKEEGQLIAANRAYWSVSEEGNRQEEARWANLIGDIFKNRGEYVEALKWFRLDYEVSIKYLPEIHLLPTCQSLGEVYLRLQHFEDTLIYQKRHLDLSKDADDLVEQQRASTQLGRTYHEMFLKSESDQTSLRNAKKYFISSMKLAHTLKKSNKLTFLKEYIDAHNNIGMVEMDLDNLEEAENMLSKGLQICDEEEMVENDDGCTRLHHNLGNVYMELRKWDKARIHIEKDIVICKNIGHCQGEAKGYINLGELLYRVQKYEDAILCYEKAMSLAKCMDDEYALVDQIKQNIEVVKEATKVMEDLKTKEQNFKKLMRNMVVARGTSGERKCLLQQTASLDLLIEKSRVIFAWEKLCEFAKKKIKIARELYDKERLGDSYLVIGNVVKIGLAGLGIGWVCHVACLKVVDLSKCQLSLVGILGMLNSLADNTSIEELNLSENALEHEYETLVKVKPQEDEEVNQDLFELEVASDSEDESEEEKACVDRLFESKSTFLQQLSAAISLVKQLHVLDISNNGFSGETFYAVWSMFSRGSLTESHIEGNTIHLSVEPNQCCSIKPCCTRF